MYMYRPLFELISTQKVSKVRLKACTKIQESRRSRLKRCNEEWRDAEGGGYDKSVDNAISGIPLRVHLDNPCIWAMILPRGSRWDASWFDLVPITSIKKEQIWRNILSAYRLIKDIVPHTWDDSEVTVKVALPVNKVAPNHELNAPRTAPPTQIVQPGKQETTA